MKRLLFFLLFTISSLYGGSIKIYNNSSFDLVAHIRSANGQTLGQVSLAPQEQKTWQDKEPSSSSQSETPYTVVLLCKNGKVFGVIDHVSQGGFVSVQQARGTCYCETDDKDKKTH